MEKIAVFDVDGTLSRGFYLPRFAEALYKEGLFLDESLELIRSALSAYARGGYSYEQFAYDVITAFGKGVQGKNQLDVRLIGKKCVETQQEKFIFTDSLVGLVKRKSYIPIIITGSPADIIIPFAETLGIQTVFATEYEVRGPVFTGKVLENRAIEAQKRRALRTYTETREVNLLKSTGFGDSHHDLAFLEIVGYPVAVNPNEQLLTVAQKNNWLICKEGEDVVGKMASYLG